MNFKLLFSLILLIGIWSCENSTSTDTKTDDKKTEAHAHDHDSGDHSGHGHSEAPKSAMDSTTLLFPGETHFANLKQLTFTRADYNNLLRSQHIVTKLDEIRF